VGQEAFHWLRRTRQIPGRNTEAQADESADQMLETFIEASVHPLAQGVHSYPQFNALSFVVELLHVHQQLSTGVGLPVVRQCRSLATICRGLEFGFEHKRNHKYHGYKPRLCGNDFALDDLAFDVYTNSSTAASIDTAVQLVWNSQSNQIYQVQYATRAATNHWLNLGPPLPGTGSTNYFFDSTFSQPQTFYRVLYRSASPGNNL